MDYELHVSNVILVYSCIETMLVALFLAIF